MGIWAAALSHLGWVPPLDLPEESPDVIVSLSYALKDTVSLTPTTELVTVASAQLYRQYECKPLVMFTTGDFLVFNGKKDSEIEAEVRTKLLLSLGVNPRDIVPIFGTHNTRSETENVRKAVFRKVPHPKAIVLCTHYMHSRRALEIFRDAFDGMRVYNYPVVCDKYVNNLLPFARRWSGRSEFIWSSYMIVTWVLNKLRVI